MCILTMIFLNATLMFIGIDGEPIGFSGKMHCEQCHFERAIFVDKGVPSGMITCFKL